MNGKFEFLVKNKEASLYENFGPFLMKISLKTEKNFGQKWAFHITIRGCYIKINEIKCDCLYKIVSTNVSS
jgi:hypothetical protein